MREIDFVGNDPDSDREECPAVFRDPVSGDFYQQGRVVTDPEIIAAVTGHGVIGADEAVVWQPAAMAPILAEAATGSYDQGRQGPGQPTFRQLLATCTRSAVHLEMRDTYDPTTPAFRDWLSGGSGIDDGWDDWCELIGSAVARGVTVRRARIVSEPVTDYIRWEHMVTKMNIKAGEDVRWLPRPQASGLLLPHADLWMFDQRLVRYNYNSGDGASLRQYEFVSDPRHVAQVVAAFEMVWERAIPHEQYNPD
ncbi:DUF6879 family protein [Actinomadura miaoliensis]|uniref:DUF6879 domain-containing protein n=1 Tax=Actinomadura miaoliensis TaxID=430685 RepID=A0ABP7W7A3_9ACTN